MKRLAIAFVLASAAAAAAVAAPGDAARTRILDGYAAAAKKETPSFSGFSAERGQKLYLGPHAGAKAEANACATCHTQNPAAPGRHYRTGRAIEPMAVSANPQRFTDAAEVEKRFERDCKAVIGRPCTAQEKGDFIAFLSAR